MKKTRFIHLFFCLAILSSAFSQKGKHGAQTVSIANVKVNEFTALTANATVGNTNINVAASSLNANARFTGTLAPGDLIMIIQMQGAFMNLSTFAIPWIHDSTYGRIWNYATCGNYEFAEVKSVLNGTQIELTCGLQFSYSSSGKTQIVRVPRYSSLNVTNTGTLTTDAWNGTIGGILAVEVDGNTTINGIVTANGLGFRGGVAVGNNSSGNSSFRTRNPNDGAEKGEGIGSDRLSNTAIDDSLGKQCKGAPANGGGGGNANNCGGGGGGNGGVISNYNGCGIPGAGFNAIWDLEWLGRSGVTSSGGGKGGYGTSTTTTVNINLIGPNNTAWGSFKRPSYGGFGGRPLDYSTGRIFMGGGGGAGHMSTGQSNGANACSGGAGGGIIYFLNYGTLSGTGTISSNGANGNNAFGTASIINPTQGIDGAGGAGAGGTIILKSNGTISGITTNANGGNGGNQVKSGTTNSEGQGPGGGGSGGYISATNIGFTQSVNGGANGTTNATAFDTEFPMNGATSGDIGTNNQIITPSYSLTASANQTLCTNQSTTISATSTNPSASIQWFNTATGGTSISTGTIYATPVYTATGTYTVYAASCPGIYRLPIVITVSNGAIITVNSPTICPNQTVTLTANGATTYTWNNGATTNTISVSPTSTSIYTINASAGSCNAIQTATVTVSSQPTVSVANATICSGSSATLTAIGAASYTWTPGGQTTSSVVVTPTTNTTYTITGSNGACTNSTTASVSISTTPTLSASSQTICSGQVATFTVNGATSYTWNPGNTTGSSYTTSPASSGTVSVLGTNGTCTAQITRSITVNPNPIVAASNQTICPSQSVTLTASGATTYSWNNGATTNTISVSPSSLTIYTVIGTTSSCSNTKTVSVTVASQPTIAVASNSICSGSTTILTSSGATNYTWTPGGQTTSSIAVTPTTNTTYSITGSNGTCSNTTTATVSVTSTPTLVVNSITICPGQTATLTATGATSYTWNPGNVSGSSYTIAPGTNTTVTIIGSNGTCSSSATASVTIGAGISISVNSETICAGQTVSLIANGATTYTWDSGANTSTLNVSPTSTTVYTISGSSGSCNGTNTATVTVVSQPTVTVNSSSICSSSSATLVASGANNYTWTPGGQTTSSIVVTPTTNTTYSITGSNGTCSNTTIATVSVTATPTLIANSVTICPGQTATLTASGASSYTWNPGNVSGNSYTIAPGANTTVTIIGSNGTCSSSATASVTIGAGISISVNSETICPGQTATLNATGATTYTWDSGSNNNSITVSPLSTTIYTISGASGSCFGNNTSTVTVVSQPTITVSNATICSGSSATLTASGASTYSWNPGSVTGSSISISPSVSTTYTITGSNGVCTNTSTSVVSVINCTSSCSFSLGNDTSFCSPLNFTINGPVGYNSYLWLPGGTTNQNLNVTSAGTYTCTAMFYSNDLIINGDFSAGDVGFTTSYILGTGGTWGSVSNPGTYSITTNPNLAHTNFFSFGDHTTGTGNMMVCNGASSANTVVWSQTISIVPNTNYNFSAWVASTENMNAGDEAQLQFSINGSLIGSVFNAPLTGGNWVNFFTNWNSGANTSATITIVDQNTIGNNDFALDDIFFQQICTYSDEITITENIIPTVTASASNSVICNGNTTSLIGGGASTYTWTSGVTNGAAFSPTVTTTYTVIGTSVAGCTNTAIKTITVNPTPTITVNNATVCSGQTATIIANGAITYTWSNNVNGNSQTVNPNSTTIYTVSGTDINGCVNNVIATSTVNINTTPVADFNSSEGYTVTVGNNITLTNISSNADTYEWNVLCTGLTSNANNLNIAFVDTGNCCINLVANTIAGCSDTIQKCISIVKEAVVVIPNVFTPNGDGSNDVFKINSNGLKTLTCAIYDRWGLKIYEWDGINGYWDGTTKSGLAADGTYFYIATYTDFKDKSTAEKGFLNLFKN